MKPDSRKDILKGANRSVERYNTRSTYFSSNSSNQKQNNIRESTRPPQTSKPTAGKQTASPAKQKDVISVSAIVGNGSSTNISNMSISRLFYPDKVAITSQPMVPSVMFPPNLGSNTQILQFSEARIVQNPPKGYCLVWNLRTPVQFDLDVEWATATTVGRNTIARCIKDFQTFFLSFIQAAAELESKGLVSKIGRMRIFVDSVGKVLVAPRNLFLLGNPHQMVTFLVTNQQEKLRLDLQDEIKQTLVNREEVRDLLLRLLCIDKTTIDLIKTSKKPLEQEISKLVAVHRKLKTNTPETFMRKVISVITILSVEKSGIGNNIFSSILESLKERPAIQMEAIPSYDMSRFNNNHAKEVRRMVSADATRYAKPQPQQVDKQVYAATERHKKQGGKSTFDNSSPNHKLEKRKVDPIPQNSIANPAQQRATSQIQASRLQQTDSRAEPPRAAPKLSSEQLMEILDQITTYETTYFDLLKDVLRENNSFRIQIKQTSHNEPLIERMTYLEAWITVKLLRAISIAKSRFGSKIFYPITTLDPTLKSHADEALRLNSSKISRLEVQYKQLGLKFDELASKLLELELKTARFNQSQAKANLAQIRQVQYPNYTVYTLERLNGYMNSELLSLVMIIETPSHNGVRMDLDLVKKIRETVARNHFVQTYESYQPVSWTKENEFTKTTFQYFDPQLVKGGLKDHKTLGQIYQDAREKLYDKNPASAQSSAYASPPKKTTSDSKRGLQSSLQSGRNPPRK